MAMSGKSLAAAFTGLLLVLTVGVWAFMPLQRRSAREEKIESAFQHPPSTEERDRKRWDVERVELLGGKQLRENKVPPPPPRTAPQIDTPEEPPEPPPSLTLLMVIRSGNYAQAVLRGSDGKTETVRIGDRVSGLEVIKINQRDVLLVTETGQSLTVALPDREGSGN